MYSKIGPEISDALTSAYAYFTGLSETPPPSALLAVVRETNFLDASSHRATKAAAQHHLLIKKLIFQNGIQDIHSLASGPIMPPLSLEAALTWCFQIAQIGRSPINTFIQNRKLFGKHLLQGDYHHARLALEQIRTDTGWSLYYVEKRLLLEHAQHGSHAAKTTLDTLSSEFKQPGLRILAHVYKIRTESLFNRWSFDAHLESIFNIPDSDLLPVTRDEFTILVDGATLYFGRNQLEHIASCISRFSFVDAYLLTLKISRLAIFGGILSQDEIDALGQSVKNTLRSIKDEHLRTLLTALEGTTEKTEVTITEAAFLELQGRYLTGDFEGVVTAGAAFLERDPLNADVYDLIAKAIVHRDSTDSTWKTRSSCLSYRIIDSLSVLYSESGSSSLAIADLESIAIALGDNHLSYFLRSICQKYQGLSFADDYINYGFLNNRNSTSVVVFESSSRRFRSQKKKRKNASSWENLAVDFSAALHECSDRLLTKMIDSLHPMLFAISSARIYAEQEDWDQVIQATAIIANSPNVTHDPRWFRQLAVHRLRALLATKHYSEAKLLFGICYCKLNNFIRSLNLIDLSQTLTKLSVAEDFDLELLTISAHCAEDSHDRAVALRDLISSNAILSRLPSSLISTKHWEKNPLAALVFSRLFPAEVLKYTRLPRSGGANRYEDALTEYINSCALFLAVDDHDVKRDICLSMISAYAEMRERLVWEAVAGPRIVVRIEKLRIDLQPIIDSQFREFSTFDRRNKKDVIERCFDIIRSEFVYNKRYGLSSSLGTKIRHGFFYNAFFDALESSGLAGRKRIEGTDDWAPPDLGELGVFCGDTRILHKLNMCLQDLSYQFVAQVKRFRDSTIAIITTDSLREERGGAQELSEFKFDSFEAEIENGLKEPKLNGAYFFDWATEQLTSRLRANLSVIRTRIINELYELLNTIISEFDIKLRSLSIANHHKQNLSARAHQLQSELRAVCTRVSQWFDIVNEGTLERASIRDVFNVIAKDASVSNRIVPDIAIDVDLIGSWTEVDIWYHVFSILFENARSATGKLGAQFKVILFAKIETPGSVSLGCRNQLRSSSEATEACQRISEVVETARLIGSYGPKESGISRAIDLLEDLTRLKENISWQPEGNEVVIKFLMQQIDETTNS